jgi:hypothetical protein
MTARVITVPPRRVAAVWILRLHGAWLVLWGEDGWLHGNYDDAVEDARWLADKVNLRIRWRARA